MQGFESLKHNYGGCCALCSKEHGVSGKILTLNTVDYAVCVDCGYFADDFNGKTVADLKRKLSLVIESVQRFIDSSISSRFGCSGNTDLKNNLTFYFERYLDKRASLEEKLNRSDLRDQTHRHIYTMCRYLNQDNRWFFWDFNEKRWIEAKNHDNDCLVMEGEF